MLKRYVGVLKRLISGIFDSNSSVTLGDYLEALKYTFMLIGSVVLVGLVVTLVVWLPKKVYRKFVGELEVKISQLYRTEGATEEYTNKLYKELRRNKAIYWFGFGFVYVPFMIPTVLLVMDLIIGLF